MTPTERVVRLGARQSATMSQAVPLVRRKRELTSIFDLLGGEENDITAALGWTLSRSGRFLHALVEDVFPGAAAESVTQITLQERTGQAGYTDVALHGEHMSCVIEAKRGWHLPAIRQLKTYAKGLTSHPGRRALLVISECSQAYASPPRLPTIIREVPVRHRNWEWIGAAGAWAARSSRGPERQVLREFAVFLRRVTSMRDQQSNRVYVLALADGVVEGGSISWQGIVTEKHLYFHPYARGGWPVDPPNYLGFRYGGRLQSIHHVERYEIVDEPSRHIPEVPRWGKGEYILYWLGPPVLPPHRVRSTGMRNARCWAALDLLLTCSTVTEARDKTKERISEDTTD